MRKLASKLELAASVTSDQSNLSSGNRNLKDPTTESELLGYVADIVFELQLMTAVQGYGSISRKLQVVHDEVMSEGSARRKRERLREFGQN